MDVSGALEEVSDGARKIQQAAEGGVGLRALRGNAGNGRLDGSHIQQ